MNVLPTIFALLIPVAIAYGVTAAATPAIVRVALRYRILDFPDGERRSHSAPIPRLGSIGVLLGLGAALVAGGALSAWWLHAPDVARFRLPGLAPALFVAGAMLFVIGLLDDLFDVSPAVKLVAQVAAAWITWQAGFRIDQLVLPGEIELTLGRASLPVTLLWLVGVSNAFNLVDGLDGLAGSIASIALAGAATIALALGTPLVAWYALALLGAMLGFLRHNLPPARIFLGDSGSLVVGFYLAVVTVVGATRLDGGLHALAPLLLLAYPLLDTAVAIARRWLRGEPLSRADHQHVHHRLRDVGLSPGRALAVLCALAVLMAVLGTVGSLAAPSTAVAIAGASALILALFLRHGVRSLHYHEFQDAASSVAGAVRGLGGVIQDLIHAHDAAEVIERAGSVAEVDDALARVRDLLRLERLELRSGHRHRSAAREGIIDLHGDALCHLEFPVAVDPHASDPLLLLISSQVTRPRSSIPVERVARILSPSVASWARRVRPTIGLVSEAVEAHRDARRGRPAVAASIAVLPASARHHAPR